MRKLTPITDYAWPSDKFAVCTVDVPVAELAERLGLPLVRWEENGLGSATGFSCRLDSGLILFLEEFEHARKHLGARGPTIYVDASELVERGIQGTLAIALDAMGLSTSNVTWLQEEVSLDSARWLVKTAKEMLRK